MFSNSILIYCDLPNLSSLGYISLEKINPFSYMIPDYWFED